MENSPAACIAPPRGAAPAPQTVDTLDAFDVIARFCAEQHYAFDPADWLRMASRSRGVLPVLARYLAGTSWYGHSDELESFARLIDEDAGTTPPAGGIDIARFSGAIRVHIARRRLPGPVTENPEEV